MPVRRVRPDETELIRSLRLAALGDAPRAFDSTLERELARTVQDWQTWIAGAAVFVHEPLDGGSATGLAVGFPHWTEPQVVVLGSVWVHPLARGLGVGAELVHAVRASAQELNAREIRLDVARENEFARRLYERCGFAVTGVEWTRERDGCAEIEMRLLL